ncbi:hypothetical protein OCJ37_14340 [Xanthomonas sp. AM6]|uniref:hypothetical protein n=1 Tax=Xanthomonas sp. AM6 TaxID=2982531 RepID=UPI0021DB6361|nr:hypothetical protein [Xanthomonas sp. AM6]UYB51165.1 hypothetical protein OCJ37_14340 [Xanthomonas sp. AM6]
MGIVTIVPAAMDEHIGTTPTRGTKVLVDGVELKGVTRVVLMAEVDDIWRAHIECYAEVQTMPGMWLEVHERPRLTWWRRLLLRAAGVSVAGPYLGSTAQPYEKP